jgi:hypothetical protein
MIYCPLHESFYGNIMVFWGNYAKDWWVNWLKYAFTEICTVTEICTLLIFLLLLKMVLLRKIYTFAERCTFTEIFTFTEIWTFTEMYTFNEICTFLPLTPLREDYHSEVPFRVGPVYPAWAATNLVCYSKPQYLLIAHHISCEPPYLWATTSLKSHHISEEPPHLKATTSLISQYIS